jgi:hypothetical protein
VIALPTILATFAATAPAPVTLTVRYTAGSQVEQVAHLRCRGDSARADGFLRTSALPACRRARKIASFLDSRPSSKRVCTQIYGGPQEALVTGRFRGHSVRAHFSRQDGCEIGRWDRVRFLFPGAVSASDGR